jgi:hypothetical protein
MWNTPANNAYAGIAKSGNNGLYKAREPIAKNAVP